MKKQFVFLLHRLQRHSCGLRKEGKGEEQIASLLRHISINTTVVVCVCLHAKTGEFEGKERGRDGQEQKEGKKERQGDKNRRRQTHEETDRQRER